MSYVKYDSRILRKLQETELEILKDFDDLCTRHNIDYFGIGGTAIGAVRHKGFIPWDDDIDVAMMREDYEMFLKYAEKEYSEKYYILKAEEGNDFPGLNVHWCKKGTKFIQKSVENLSCDFGIFLDIFIFDYVYDDEKHLKRQAYSAWFWGKLYVLYHVKKPNLLLSGLTAKFISLCCVIGHNFMHLFGVSPKFLYSKALNISMKLKNNNQKSNTISYFFETEPYKLVLKYDDVFPAKRMEFEGLMIKFPNKIDKMLKKRYGDYMKLPPKNKRHNHPPCVLDFGDSNEKD